MNNIFKFIKDTITKIINDDYFETSIKLGNGHVKLERDSEYGDYDPILDFSINKKEGLTPTKKDSRKHEDDNARYYCAASSIINIGNIFGGIYATSFVVKEGSPCDEYDYFEKFFERFDMLEEAKMCYYGAKVGNTCLNPEIYRGSVPLILWNVDLYGHEDAFVVLRYMNTSKYNKQIPKFENISSSIEEQLTSLIDINSTTLYGFNKVLISAFYGFEMSIRTGYDDTLVDINDELKIKEENRVPTSCQFFNIHADKKNVSLTKDFSQGFLEVEKLIIGKTIKDVCELSYIPEILYCSWNDIERIDKLRKKYKVLFDSPKLNEVIKLNLLSESDE